MKFSIKERFNLSNLINELSNSKIEDYDLDNSNKSIIQFNSFIADDKVSISHKDIPDIELKVPLYTPLYFNIQDIEDELYRFESIYKYKPFISSKYRNRRLISYCSNPLLISLFNYLISLNNYQEYHFFPLNNICSNSLKYLEKKYANNRIRINEVESEFISTLRVCLNEYDDLYNSDDINDHRIVFFTRNDSIDNLCNSVELLDNFYISMPKNSVLYYSMVHMYRYIKRFEMVSQSKKFLLIKVDRDTKRYMTTLMFINKVKALFDKIMNELKK